jgi:murein DD-endopeptidase MepM/ murein hydrolase activator NlpD
MTCHRIIALAAVILTGCASISGARENAATIMPPNNPDTDSGAIPTDPEPASPTATPPPALGLPDPSGVVVACAENSLVLPLGESFGAASRILAREDWLYVLIDGELYRTVREEADLGQLQLEPILVAGQDVDGHPVHELVDLAMDPAMSALYALDKVGHVYHVEPSGGTLSLVYRAAPNNDDPLWIEPQFAALATTPDGEVMLLDTAQTTLWQPDTPSTLQAVAQTYELYQGVDVAQIDGTFYVLGYDGSIVQVSRGTGTTAWRGAPSEPGLMLSLFASEHLGAPLLYVVDGLNRLIIGLDPETGESLTATRFALPSMGLLRDVSFAGGRLYGVADTMLIVFPGPETGTCDTIEAYAFPSLYGENSHQNLVDFAFPIAGAWLPPWPRLYPGANRLYRMGIHHGLDIHEYTAPPGFDIGTPVLAVADGQVVEAGLNYTPVSADEFDGLVGESQTLGYTPPEAMQRLYGRRIVIEHAGGIQTVYAHLSDIAPEINVGTEVTRGQVIGAVGVSGTMGDGAPGTVLPHLHVEIWIDGRYLGQGMTLRETMWWFEQVFGD